MHFSIILSVLGSLYQLLYADDSLADMDYSRIDYIYNYEDDKIDPYVTFKHFKSDKFLSRTGKATDTNLPLQENVFEEFNKPDNYTLILTYPGLNTTGDAKAKCMDVQSGCYLDKIVTEYKCNKGRNQDFQLVFNGPVLSTIYSGCNSNWALTVLPDGTQVLKDTGDENYQQEDFYWIPLVYKFTN